MQHSRIHRGAYHFSSVNLFFDGFFHFPDLPSTIS
uniref:Uncharacterized protein n=1 Tax=Siphoviridae sp. ctNZc11 TaxID=2827858 RepID=A0A8S5TCT8_9CAUD|nr:MAG TPA: hypothetical protein [Siphoviridae sp. ctNZc11]